MNEDTQQKPSRRTFLGTLAGCLGFAALVELVWVIGSFFKPKKQSQEVAEQIITAGPVDSFEIGSVTTFIRGRFYLSRLEDGSFIAMSCACTHLGCTVNWELERNRFECPCHGSSFDIRGDVLTAPAPRALDYFPVTIENLMVKVDTGQKIERAQFDPQQVTAV
jgi:cytochrome b6-f complex iron-sulfur subunit